MAAPPPRIPKFRLTWASLLKSWLTWVLIGYSFLPLACLAALATPSRFREVWMLFAIIGLLNLGFIWMILTGLGGLRESEEQFRALVESARDAIVSADHRGNIIAWNRGAEAIFGYPAEEIVGRPLTALMPERFRNAHEHGIVRYNQTGEPRAIGKTLELAGIRRDGQEFPLELSLSTWTTQDGKFFTAIIRDITERKEVEGRLQQSNALLVKHQGELLGASRELEATQLRLVQAAKLESVGRLAAGVAHEVKNPLATLLIGIDHLTDFFPDRDPQLSRLLQDMKQAVRRADMVIKGLLNFASYQQLDVASADLGSIIDQALLLVRHGLDRGHITVARELAEGLPPVELDRTKIEQVFVNLFMNAIDAMPDGGTLRIRTAVLAKNGASVVAVIEDSGTGIPSDKLGRVFEPFFTTKPTGKGTGLGLAVAKTIIDLHDGHIDVVNRPEGGVSVTLRLPCKHRPGLAEGGGHG